MAIRTDVREGRLMELMLAVAHHRHQATLELRTRVLAHLEMVERSNMEWKDEMMLFFDGIVNPEPNTAGMEYQVKELLTHDANDELFRESWRVIDVLMDMENRTGRPAREFLNEYEFRDELTRRSITRQEFVHDPPSWAKIATYEATVREVVRDGPTMTKARQESFVKEILLNYKLYTASILLIREQWLKELADRIYGPE